jgi:hypothetical protein
MPSSVAPRTAVLSAVGARNPFPGLWVTVKPYENGNRRGGAAYGSYTSQNTGG